MSQYTEGLINLKIQALQTEMARLQRLVPVRIGDQQSPQTIIIIGGQSFGALGGITTYGILKHNGILSGIPNGTYDPGTVNPTTGAETVAPTPAIDAWPDGIGPGTRWTGSAYKRVIVCNDSRGTAQKALIGGASDDTTYAPSDRQETIFSQRVITVAKVDLTVVSCYSPDFT